jgi:hypothetical protein
VATTSAFLAQSAFPTNAAAVDSLVTFEDANCGFQIKIPSSWEKQVQELPDRRKIVLFIDPTGDKDKTLCFIAYTPIRDDFTQISSFGSVDQVRVSLLRVNKSSSLAHLTLVARSFKRLHKPRFFPKEAWQGKTMKAQC